MTKHKTLFFILSIFVILCLSSCGDSSASVESASDSIESTVSQKPVNTTPIVSKSDLTGIWTGGQSTDVGHIKYLYFSSNGVYWMANKDG